MRKAFYEKNKEGQERPTRFIKRGHMMGMIARKKTLVSKYCVQVVITNLLLGCADK